MIDPQYFIYDDHTLFFGTKNDAQEYLEFIKTDKKAAIYRDVVKLYPDEGTISGLSMVYSDLLKEKLSTDITYLRSATPMQLLSEDALEQNIWNVTDGDRTGWIIIHDWMKIAKVEPGESGDIDE